MSERNNQTDDDDDASCHLDEKVSEKVACAAHHSDGALDCTAGDAGENPERDQCAEEPTDVHCPTDAAFLREEPALDRDPCGAGICHIDGSPADGADVGLVVGGIAALELELGEDDVESVDDFRLIGAKRNDLVEFLGFLFGFLFGFLVGSGLFNRLFGRLFLRPS